MMHVRTDVQKSSIHGLGLFTLEKISKGTVVYTPNEKLDLTLSEQEFSVIEQKEQERIAHYGFFNKKSKKWHLAHDDIRFVNHSKASNIALINDQLVATRDIEAGEELLQDYEEFEELRAGLS